MATRIVNNPARQGLISQCSIDLKGNESRAFRLPVIKSAAGDF
jgi:hypothetical protein